jgi:hypothetical protein
MSTVSNNPFDIDAIRQASEAIFGSTPVRATGPATCQVIKRQRTKFIKGPIPLPWVTQAFQLPGKAGGVAITLQYLAGLQQTQIVMVEPQVIREFGFARSTVRRCLRDLEGAGLIRVSRGAGRAPVVTILGAKGPCDEYPPS